MCTALFAGALSAGCFGAPGYRGPATERFDGDRFSNQAEFDRPGFWRLVWWQLTSDERPWPDRVEVPQARPPMKRVGDGRVRVTFVNHASTLIQVDGVNLLTDPVWADRIGPVSWAGPSRRQTVGVKLEDLPPIDAILISHDHYDHLDMPTVQKIAQTHGCKVIAGLGTRALLSEHGVSIGVDLDWWQREKVGAVEVVLAPSQHWSGRGLGDAMNTLWGSFVIAGPSGVVYFAGDTAAGPHFAQVRERFGPVRAALLPIGAYRPRWFMQPQHISPDEAVDAHIALGAKKSVAIHWGTFDLSDEGIGEPVDDLVSAMKQKGVAPGSFVASHNGTVFEL